MQRRFHAEQKSSAEFLVSGDCCWQRHTVFVQQLNPFFHSLAQFGVNFSFVVSMHTAAEQRRAAAHEALVFVTPFDKLYAARRLFFNLTIFCVRIMETS